VLSGGGARGITHIGVLKVLREMRVPIDYVAGTSMGAIVGGLYASGMTPQDMERHLIGISWPTLLSDSPERSDAGFRRKELEQDFPLGLELGFRDGSMRMFKGALSGNNLELMLHELTRNVDNLASFNQLPIPFRAVATDMVTGKEVVFDHGPLYQAMRASMSVPGMFAPAEIDGRILGDGGLVNNLPVDIVRAMGADIVIAVNIGTPLMSREQLSSAVGYAAQMVNILTEQNVRAQLALLKPTDILISPDLGDLTFLDFTAGPQFVELGEKAARAAHDRLAALSDTPAQFARVREEQMAPPDHLPKTLAFVRIEGTQFANPKVLEKALRTQPNEPFDIETLDADMARLYGRGDYEQVDYRLVTENGEQGVIINVREKSWGPNYLRFGLDLSTDLQGDSQFNVNAGHRRVWVNSYGAEWTNTVTLGSTRRYATEFYQPLNIGNFAFGSVYGLIQRAPEYIFDGENRLAQYDVLTENAGIDIGMPIGTSGEIRFGPAWTHYRGDPQVASPEFPLVKSSETGVRLLLRWDSLDNPFFPRRGLKFTGEVFGGRRTDTVPELQFESTYNSGRAQLYTNAGFAFTENSFINVAARAGGIRAERDNVISDFNLGGFLNLSGLRTNELSGNYMALARVVYYQKIGNIAVIARGVYVGGSIEAGNTWASRDSIDGVRVAGSVFLAADTFIGPAYFAYGRTSGGRSSFYLFVGRP